MPRAATRAAVALLTAVLAAGVLVVRPIAATGQAPGLAPVMLVLDASGSMQEALPGGRTKMVMTHAGIPADSPGAAGWATAFDKLAVHV